MEKKIGQIIKEVVERKKIGATAFSRTIGVSRNNVYDIYERSSIDTELLKRIGQFLDYDFFQHFLEPETIEKIKFSEKVKPTRVLVELELNEDEMMKIGFEEKMLKILNKKE